MNRLSLIATALALLALPARTETRTNEKVLALLPSDISAYVGIEDLRRAMDAAKEYINRVAPNTKLFDDLLKQGQAGLEQLPEPFRTSARDGLKNMISAHFALTHDSEGELGQILIVRTEDEKFLIDLLHEQLKLFQTESLKVGDRSVVRFDLGDRSPIKNGYVVIVKDLAIAASSLPLLKDILARLDGQPARPGLKGTPIFERLSTANAGPIGLKIYFDANTLLNQAMESPYTSARYSAYQRDQADALLGFSDVRGAFLDVSYKEGKIQTTFDLEIGKKCVLYHSIFRQKAGTKEILAYAPADASAVAHINIESGDAFLKQLKGMFQRGREVFSEGREGRDDEWDNFARHFERGFGIPVEEAARLIDDEAALFFAPSDWDAMQRDVNGLCFLIKTKNAEGIREAAKKIAAGREFRGLKWAEKPYKGVSIFTAEATDFAPSYAVDANVLIFGAGEKTIQKAIDAKAGANLAKLATTPGSKVVALNLKSYLRAFNLFSRGQVPDWYTSISDGLLDTGIAAEGDDRISATAQDTGTISTLLAVLCWSMMSFSARVAFEDPEDPGSGPKKPAAEADIPKVDLPKDARQAEAMIAGLIDDLSSDEPPRRDAATRKLKGIGEPAIKALSKAAQSGDPEVKTRAEEILLFLKAFDAFPGLLDRRVNAVVDDLKKILEGPRAQWFSAWQPNQEGIWNIEPSNNYYFAASFARLDLEVLDSPAAMRKFAKLMTSADLKPITRQHIGAILLRRNTASCSEELRQAFEAGELEIKCYALIGLGRGADDKARDLVLKNLESDQLAMRRSAFLAAEKTGDPRVIPVLLKQLEAKDPETRFNASYTLGKRLKGAVRVNSSLPPAERAEAIKAAQDWWAKNQGTFKPDNK